MRKWWTMYGTERSRAKARTDVQMTVNFFCHLGSSVYELRAVSGGEQGAGGRRTRISGRCQLVTWAGYAYLVLGGDGNEPLEGGLCGGGHGGGGERGGSARGKKSPTGRRAFI